MIELILVILFIVLLWKSKALRLAILGKEKPTVPGKLTVILESNGQSTNLENSPSKRIQLIKQYSFQSSPFRGMEIGYLGTGDNLIIDTVFDSEGEIEAVCKPIQLGQAELNKEKEILFKDGWHEDI